jgi:DNA-binding MarR family transcriptional regulator
MSFYHMTSHDTMEFRNMPGLASVERYAAKLADAVNNGNWEILPRHLERVKQIFLDALVRNERELVAAVAKAISDTATLLRADSPADEALDRDGAAWLLASDAMTATLGLRLLPADFAKAEGDTEARNVQDEVLNLLMTVGCALTTNEISMRIGRRQETVSRALTGLRARLAVRTVPAGRARKHSVTAHGRALLARSLSALPKGPANEPPYLILNPVETADAKTFYGKVLMPAEPSPEISPWLKGHFVSNGMATGHAQDNDLPVPDQVESFASSVGIPTNSEIKNPAPVFATLV